MLAEGIFCLVVAFPPGDKTKFYPIICGTELGKTLPGYGCSESMLGTLSAINCFEGNNSWLKDCK